MKRYSCDGCIIGLIDSVNELESIKSEWLGMQSHPNSDFDHYIAVIKNRPDSVISPLVFIIYRNASPAGLVIARLESSNLPLNIGYKTILNLPIRSINIIYNGLLGIAGSEEQAVLALSRKLLRSYRAQMIQISMIPVTSPLYLRARKISPLLYSDVFSVRKKHWVIKLPATYEEYFQSLSKSTRGNIKNYNNRLIKKNNDTISFKCYEDISDLGLIMTNAEKIAKDTFQRSLEVGFVHSMENRDRFEAGLKNRSVKAFFLYAGNEPIAFDIGWLYNNVFYLECRGFADKFKDFHPGIVLLMDEINFLLTNKSISEFDFGFGDAVYKEIFGNYSFMEANVFVSAKRAKALIYNLLRLLFLLINSIAETILKRFKLYDLIKKTWRRLIKK